MMPVRAHKKGKGQNQLDKKMQNRLQFKREYVRWHRIGVNSVPADERANPVSDFPPKSEISRLKSGSGDAGAQSFGSQCSQLLGGFQVNIAALR